MSSVIVFIFISSFTNWSYFTDEEFMSKINALTLYVVATYYH